MTLMEPIDASACWNCVSGLRSVEKSGNFRATNLSLTWWSKVFETWMNEMAYSCYLLQCCGSTSRVVCWAAFLFSVGQVLGWNFLVLKCYGNVCIWIPKMIWPRMGWFESFCQKRPRLVDFLSVLTGGCNRSWNVFLFWRNRIFLIVFLGVFWFVFEECLFLVIWFSNIGWWAWTTRYKSTI